MAEARIDAGLAAITLTGAIIGGLLLWRGQLLGGIIQQAIGAHAPPITLTLAPPKSRGADSIVTVAVWLPPSRATAPYKVLFYTPGSGRSHRDNDQLSATMAARGYLVVSLDDIEHAPELSATSPSVLRFDFSNATAYARTLALADAKTMRQAQRLSLALDGLQALANAPAAPDWLRRADFARVGAFGWSLGGSSSAEASVNDQRIASVANMDGWLFGKAAHGAVQAPYLLILSDFPPPDQARLTSGLAHIRYEAELTMRDLREEWRLIRRPGSMGLQYAGAIHESFSTEILRPQYWRTWLKQDPVALRRNVAGCLDGFFRARLSTDSGDDVSRRCVRSDAFRLPIAH